MRTHSPRTAEPLRTAPSARPTSPKAPRHPRNEHGDSGDAFLPDVARHDGVITDDVESYAETFIANATAAEDIALDASDEVVVDEFGGPFVEDAAPSVPGPLDELAASPDDGGDGGDDDDDDVH